MVIGIIAVLVSILFPAFGIVREASRITKCASNLRQIGLAMTAYFNENQGVLMPSQIDVGGTAYPTGFFWANALVSGGYMKATTGTVSDGSSAFNCPDGIYEECIPGNGFTAKSPRDAVNQQYILQNEPSASEGVKCWYALNSATSDSGSGIYPGGSVDAPFVWVEQNNYKVDVTLANPLVRRTLSNIRQPTVMVMAFDGNAWNWASYSWSTGFSSRISGRHGAATNKGLDGNFNCLFFDGHVDLLSTEPYTLAGQGGNALNVTPDTAVFFMHLQPQ